MAYVEESNQAMPMASAATGVIGGYSEGDVTRGWRTVDVSSVHCGAPRRTAKPGGGLSATSDAMIHPKAGDASDALARRLILCFFVSISYRRGRRKNAVFPSLHRERFDSVLPLVSTMKGYVKPRQCGALFMRYDQRFLGAASPAGVNPVYIVR